MGRRSYQSQCATCHGINATGNPEAGGPDLTTGQFRRAEGEAGLFRVIREGVDGTAMIGLGENASEQTVWQLVTFSAHARPGRRRHRPPARRRPPGRRSSPAREAARAATG